MKQKIGFAAADISPPVGIELGGYAGYRPCAGVHDPLFCKAVVLEDARIRYALIVMDLLCVDEALYTRIARAVSVLGIAPERLIVSAIHSHASPCGVVLGEGPLAQINRFGDSDPAAFGAYTDSVVAAALDACGRAVAALEPFAVRTARGALPRIGSERHTGEEARGMLTVIQCRTESGKNLILYHFPCHPTVLSPANLEASADIIGGIADRLDADLAVFVNGAAGDISTRFTRRESSFAECDRMAGVAAEAISALIDGAQYREPTPIKGIHSRISLRAREVESEETACRNLEEATLRWKQAEAEGMEPGKLRLLKTYVEGAGVSLEFSRIMGGIRQFELPVTVFSFAGLKFATVPGELYSTLWHDRAVPICYANGYYRYIADRGAYDDNDYEAMAAILARGEGEVFADQLNKLLEQLDITENGG